MARTKKWPDPVTRHYMVTGKDFQALDYLMRKYAINRRGGVARLAIRAQARRDGARDERLTQLYDRVRSSVVGLQQYSYAVGREKAGFVRWTCRLDGQSLAELKAIADKHDLKKIAEAARFVVRVQAEVDGFHPKDGWDDQATEDGDGE